MANKRRYPSWKKRKVNPIQQWMLAGVVMFVSIFLMGIDALDIAIPMLQETLGLYSESNVPTVTTPGEGETQVHFIDVGQGDATLISQGGQFVLIDAGTSDARGDLISYLQHAGVETIDVLVMTHSHADHIGAMDTVIETFDIDRMILPNFALWTDTPTSATYGRVMTALAHSPDTVMETAMVGATYQIGEGTLEVLSAGVQTEECNNLSVCTKYTAGGFSVLVTGDAEVEVEEDMLAHGENVRATVFQAGHHGSTTSNSAEFVKAVHPEVAMISCGVDNSYGHPHDEIVELFDQLGIEQYRTDLRGSIVVSYTDADGMTVHCAKDAA